MCLTRFRDLNNKTREMRLGTINCLFILIRKELRDKNITD